MEKHALKKSLVALFAFLLLDSASAQTVPDTQSYVSALVKKIKSEVAYAEPHGIEGNPKVVFRIAVAPAGEVTGITKISSSGLEDFDLAVEKGIWKASPLPKKTDGSVEPVIVISYFLRPLQQENTTTKK